MSSCLKRFYFYSRLKFRILDLRLYCVIIFKSVITKSKISISLLLDFFIPMMTLSEIDRKKYCETICQSSLEKPVLQKSIICLAFSVPHSPHHKIVVQKSKDRSICWMEGGS